MRRTLLSASLDAVVPWVLAATVFAFACGSSSVGVVNNVGKPLRWAVLLVLLFVAGTWMLAVRPRSPAARSVCLAATALLALALISSLWSVDSRLSIERAISFALLFAVAFLLTSATDGNPRRMALVLRGLLMGAVGVAVAGLVLLAVDRHSAVVSASRTLATRYTGLGENPDTAALLFALALPIAAGFALRAPFARQRVLAVAIFLLLDGSIAASRSRGALVAGFVGVFVQIALARLTRRRLLVALAITAAMLGASFGGALLLRPNPDAPPPVQPASSQPGPEARPGYFNAEAHLALSYEIGLAVADQRIAVAPGFLGSSGRSVAWRGAIDLANKRPLLGYGFGSESDVFVDRYAFFAGDLVENSYIGLYLELGALGAALLVVFIATLIPVASRRRRELATGDCAGVVAAGLALGAVQSYLYSVGNIGAVTFWVCAFLLAAPLAKIAR